MKSLSPKEGNIIKDIRNIFRLTYKELNYIAIKDRRSLFKLTQLDKILR